ncbi:MAG TPA: hypothetical protein VJR89_19160, partial [Polyangiales bacterium]|nr:hypothetical protein [Polyangiales bacterium]
MNTRTWILALCLLAAACDDDAKPATAVLVTVDSDLEIGTQLSKVQIEVRNGDGERKAPVQTFTLSKDKPEGSKVRFPFSFGVARSGGDEFQLLARGLDPEGDAVVELKVVAAFEKEKTLGLHVFLGESCLNVECKDAEQTCYPRSKRGVAAGSCGDLPNDDLPVVDDPDAPPKPDERSDAGEDTDASVDAGSGGSGGRSGSGGSGGRAGT